MSQTQTKSQVMTSLLPDLPLHTVWVAGHNEVGSHAITNDHRGTSAPAGLSWTADSRLRFTQYSGQLVKGQDHRDRI